MLLYLITLLHFTPLFAQATNIYTVLSELNDNLDKFDQLLFAIMYVMGLLFCFLAISKIRRMAAKNAFQGGGEGNASGPIIQFFIGIFFLYAPTLLQIASVSLFDDDQYILAYSSTSSSGSLSDIYTNMYILIQTIGLVVLIRGFLMLNRVAQGQQSAQGGTYTKAIMFIVVAILAINIDITTSVFLGTLGLS